MFLLSCRGSTEPKLDGHVYNRENGINEVESKITTSRSLLPTTHDNRESSLHINQFSLSPPIPEQNCIRKGNGMVTGWRFRAGSEAQGKELRELHIERREET